jgi:apolipoprotein N-acyltransferase
MGLPIVRAANTGISTVITERGEVLEILEPLVKGYVISEIPIPDAVSDAGDVNSIFLWLMILILYIPIFAESLARLSRKRK